MPTQREKRPREADANIVLVSAPWPLFNRPSIQLGTLKSYLAHMHPAAKVTAVHLYLYIADAIGYERYQAISERTWLAESVYAAMLYPERTASIEKLFLRYAAGNPLLKAERFPNLVSALKKITDAAVAGLDWQSFDLAGFSMSLCQLTATLYLLKTIKNRRPDLPVVVGGTLFSDHNARQYLDCFPEIDYIVMGEGESPLLGLVQRITGRKAPHPIDGLVERTQGKQSNGRISQLSDLKALPPPDYDDYFRMLRSIAPARRFFPTLPVESSRGCYWKEVAKGSAVRGCAFCNLNLQWKGYRRKGVTQVLQEIDHLTSRHQVLSVAFMDNALPERAAFTLFENLLGLKKDFRFFAEIRATLTLQTLQTLHAAGMAEVQVGIEALSSSLLQRMNKGVRAIQNVELMRNCEAAGIKNEANLILCFPGSEEQEVAETLRAMEYVKVFRPLKMVYFWLGLGSPIWENPGAYRIQTVFNHPYFHRLFPKKIASACRFTVQAYRGDRGGQQKLWYPIKEKIRQWEACYAAWHRSPFDGPALGYRDGKSFLMLHQKQCNAETVQHRLDACSRGIYLFCQRPRTVKRMLSAFPRLSEDRLLAFLRSMTDKHLMFEESGEYLSLAVPLRRHPWIESESMNLGAFGDGT